MPLFYFDIREGTRFIPDEEGIEYRDLDAAERAAAKCAADISRDLLPKGEVREVTVELRNEHKQRVLTATISMHVERVTPEPDPPSGA